MSGSQIGTILIVDDEDELKFVLCAHLRHAGYDVLTASNGVECLEVARKHQPDVIVMDVNMPQMDGLTATRRLKSDPATGHIPVIMLTARTRTEDLVRGLEAGAQEYLAKPFDMVEILARVRTVHRLAISHQQVESLNRRLENEVREKTRRLQALYDYMRELSYAQTRDEILDLMVRHVGEATGGRRISLMLADETGEFLTCARSVGIDRALVPRIRVRAAEGIAGRVFQSGKTVVATTVGDEGRRHGESDPSGHHRMAEGGRQESSNGHGQGPLNGNGSSDAVGNGKGHDVGNGNGNGRSAGQGEGHHVQEDGAAREESAREPAATLTSAYQTDAFVSTPLVSASLRSQDEVLGVLNVTDRAEPGPFTEIEIEFVRSVADAGAIALNNLLRRTRLQDSVRVLLRTVGRLSEFRDDETSLHLERVSQYARALARRLADERSFGGTINDDFVELIAQAAPMHDIGKIGIPDNILTKPGALTQDEFTVMKTHTEIGFRVLSTAMEGTGRSPLLQMCVDIAHAHHERYDGSGYPRGLRGDQIPLPARIIALVDAYDAITSARRYKPPQSHDKALDIIRRDTGRHFDPVIARAFLGAADAFDAIRARYADKESSMAPPGATQTAKHDRPSRLAANAPGR